MESHKEEEEDTHFLLSIVIHPGQFNQQNLLLKVNFHLKYKV